MKKIKYILYSLVALCFSMNIISCSDDDDVAKQVVIAKISSVLDREAAIEKADLTQYVILQGEGFRSVSAIKVNDVAVNMDEVYLTDNEITFSIPRVVPGEVNNLVTLTTPSGDVSATLTVDIPVLKVSGMFCEFVAAGETMYVVGDYFDLYKVNEAEGKVIFGTTELPITSATATKIGFTLPTDAAAGTVIKIKGGVGEMKTVPGKYQETGFSVYDFDPYQGWGGADYISKGPIPAPVVGTQYCRFKVAKSDTGDGEWSGKTALAQFGYIKYPADVLANPSNYQFKFECCTLLPLTKRCINFYFSDLQYTWEPFKPLAFDTFGEWQTIAVDLDVVWKGKTPNGDMLQIMGNGLTEDTDICFDNLRIVSKN